VQTYLEGLFNAIVYLDTLASSVNKQTDRVKASRAETTEHAPVTRQRTLSASALKAIRAVSARLRLVLVGLQAA